jgi:maltooligosyltrehalose trehalohydrolase
MLFMGQEFASSSPFHYFTDHNPKLTQMIFKGRKEFLAQFKSINTVQGKVGNPGDPDAFQSSKLNLEERKTHRPIYQLHRDLLKLRREDNVFSLQDRWAIEGAVLGPHAFLLRYKGLGNDKLVMINLGNDLDLTPCPQPLLAPAADCAWQLIWGSEDVRYGGNGIVPALSQGPWYMPGRSAQVFSLVQKDFL